MNDHESIEKAVRRAERATNGSIAMMIEAGIKAGLAEKAEPPICGDPHHRHTGPCEIYACRPEHKSHYGASPYTPCLNERPHEPHPFWFPGDPDTGQRLNCPGVPHNADQDPPYLEYEENGFKVREYAKPHDADHDTFACTCPPGGEGVHFSDCPHYDVPHSADRASDIDRARWMQECPLPHADMKVRITQDVVQAAVDETTRGWPNYDSYAKCRAIIEAALRAAGFEVVE